MVSSKLVLQTPAVVCTVLGIVCIFVALATPAWQVVYARELQQWLQNGLWMSCKTRPTGMFTCSYAFTHAVADYHRSLDAIGRDDGTLEFYAWQRNLLYVFLVAQLLAVMCLVMFCFSHTSSLERLASILFTLLVTFAVFICCGSLIVFAIYASMVEYRFYYTSVSGIYEKHRGYSFYIALAGSVLYILALCFSLPYAIQVAHDRSPHDTDSERKLPSYSLDSVPQFSRQDLFAMRSLPSTPC